MIRRRVFLFLQAFRPVMYLTSHRCLFSFTVPWFWGAPSGWMGGNLGSLHPIHTGFVTTLRPPNPSIRTSLYTCWEWMRCDTRRRKRKEKRRGGEILRRCALWWENLNPYLVWYLGSFPGWSACQSHGQLTLQSSKVRSCSGSHMDITHIKWVRRWYILWRVIKKKTSSSPPPPPPVFRRPNPDAVLSGNPNSLFPLRENLKVGKVILLLLNAYFILFFCRLRLSSIRDLIRIESRDVAWNKLIAISYQASAGQNLQ